MQTSTQKFSDAGSEQSGDVGELDGCTGSVSSSKENEGVAGSTVQRGAGLSSSVAANGSSNEDPKFEPILVSSSSSPPEHCDERSESHKDWC